MYYRHFSMTLLDGVNPLLLLIEINALLVVSTYLSDDSLWSELSARWSEQ